MVHIIHMDPNVAALGWASQVSAHHGNIVSASRLILKRVAYLHSWLSRCTNVTVKCRHRNTGYVGTIPPIYIFRRPIMYAMTWKYFLHYQPFVRWNLLVHCYRDKLLYKQSMCNEVRHHNTRVTSLMYLEQTPCFHAWWGTILLYLIAWHICVMFCIQWFQCWACHSIGTVAATATQ